MNKRVSIMNWTIKFNGQSMPIVVNQAQFAQIIDQMHKAQTEPSQCFDEMFFATEARAWHAGQFHAKKTPTIKLDTFINIPQVSSVISTPSKPRDTRHICGCADQSKCIEYLMMGKCIDKFMCNTIGKIICPHLYGKEK